MKKYNWEKERVEKAVKKTKCWFDCLEELGIPKAGGNWRTLKKKVKEYNIDVSHFDYIYAKTHNGKHKQKKICERKDSDIFKESPKISKSNLKKEYISRVLKNSPKCEKCGITNWNGKELIFQLHHINGNNNDCRKDNLQLLCPNCHSQTENYANKKT